MTSTTVPTILLISILILLLIAFIVSILQLSQIRSKTGFSTSTNLQTAYDYSIGVLILNLFSLIFIIVVAIDYARKKITRSNLFTGLIIFTAATLFVGIILCGIAAQKSSNSAAIGNLILMIVIFILTIALIFYSRRIPKYIAPELKDLCNVNIEKEVEKEKIH